jgi:hypothetical protein
MAMPRLLWQAAWPVCKGIGMALGEIPKEAFQALAHDEEEAEVAYQTYQAYRRLENAQ